MKMSIYSKVIRYLNRHIGSYYWRTLQNLWKKQGRVAPVVFMFHKIVSSKEGITDDLCLSKETFKQLLEYLQNEGWIALTADELLSVVKSKNCPPKCYYITFDDIDESVYIEAYPILKEKMIPFSMFLCKELVDTTHYITTEEVNNMLKDAGNIVSIGGHGMHHIEFRRLTNQEVMQEYEQSYEWLKDTFRQDVEFFAFPYGDYSAVSLRNIYALKRSKYKLGFSTYEGTITPSKLWSVYFVPRVNVHEKFVERFTHVKH